MSDPTRLLQGSASELERELLASVIDEPIPGYLSQRMHSGVAVAFGAMSSGAAGALSSGAAGAQGSSGVLQGSGTLGGAASSGGVVAPGGASAGGSSFGASVLQGLSAHAGLLKGGIAGLALVGAVGTTWWWGSSSTPQQSLAQQPALAAGQTAAESSATDAAELDTARDQATDERLPTARGALPSDPVPAAEDSVVDAPRDGETAPSMAKGSKRATSTDSVSGSERGSLVGRGSTVHDAVSSKTRTSANEKVASAQPTSALDVGAEVALLDAVRQAISRGDTAVARQRLAEYERRFPNGVLRRDARVLRKAAASVDSP